MFAGAQEPLNDTGWPTANTPGSASETDRVGALALGMIAKSAKSRCISPSASTMFAATVTLLPTSLAISSVASHSNALELNIPVSGHVHASEFSPAGVMTSREKSRFMVEPGTEQLPTMFKTLPWANCSGNGINSIAAGISISNELSAAVLLVRSVTRADRMKSLSLMRTS